MLDGEIDRAHRVQRLICTTQGVVQRRRRSAALRARVVLPAQLHFALLSCFRRVSVGPKGHSLFERNPKVFGRGSRCARRVRARKVDKVRLKWCISVRMTSLGKKGCFAAARTTHR